MELHVTVAFPLVDTRLGGGGGGKSVLGMAAKKKKSSLLPQMSSHISPTECHDVGLMLTTLTLQSIFQISAITVTILIFSWLSLVS
jgi:hypothetical protein